MTQTNIRSVYSGRATNWPMVGLLVALVVPFVGLAVGSNGSWRSASFLLPFAIIIAAIVLTILAATSIRTTAGPAGVRVHFGALGWPHFQYPVAQIQRADAVDAPFSQAIWGLHWWPGRGLMLTLRAGAALQLTLGERPPGDDQYAQPGRRGGSHRNRSSVFSAAARRGRPGSRA